MMNPFRKKLCVAAILCCAHPSIADPLGDAATDLCEKVKACSMAQVAEEDMTPEMRQMMEPMLENMCASMRAGVGEVPAGHALYQPAVACMRAMASMSCEDIETMGDTEPPACEEYRRLAREAYGE